MKEITCIQEFFIMPEEVKNLNNRIKYGFYKKITFADDTFRWFWFPNTFEEGKPTWFGYSTNSESENVLENLIK